MDPNSLAQTPENIALSKMIERLNVQFLDLFTQHQYMVEDGCEILTAVYLEKLGNLQLELLQKQTEANRLKMIMERMQAAINRNERPDMEAILSEIALLIADYIAQIMAKAEAIEQARKVLATLLSDADSQKLKELFRVLCKKLHPDLNPSQTEEHKDLFIRVKAAYDLQKIGELQSILLYLEKESREKLFETNNEKAERIKHLEEQIAKLGEKISRLNRSFPFNIQDLIYDEEYILEQQGLLQTQIKTAEEDEEKYSNIISLLSDE